MTTRLAFVLILMIAAFFALDYYVLQMNAAVFLGKKAIQLMNYIAIWR